MKPPLCRFVLVSLLPLLDRAEGYSVQSRVDPKADAVQYQIKPDSFLFSRNEFGGDGYGSSQALVDNGPSDQIHDLHAKYQAAVNKAENVAQAALRAAGEALSEQNKERDRTSVNLDSFSGTRFKRSINAMEVGVETGVEPGVDVGSSRKSPKKKHKSRGKKNNEPEAADRVVMEEEPEMDEALAEEELALAEDEFPIRGLSGELTQAAYNRQYEDPGLEEEALAGAVAGVGDENNPIAVRVKGTKEPMMKLRASPSTKISPEKIDVMIDLMNSLNQQFAKMISLWDKLAADGPAPSSGPGGPGGAGPGLPRDIGGPPPFEDGSDPTKIGRMEEDVDDDGDGKEHDRDRDRDKDKGKKSKEDHGDKDKDRDGDKEKKSEKGDRDEGGHDGEKKGDSNNRMKKNKNHDSKDKDKGSSSRKRDTDKDRDEEDEDNKHEDEDDEDDVDRDDDDDRDRDRDKGRKGGSSSGGGSSRKKDKRDEHEDKGDKKKSSDKKKSKKSKKGDEDDLDLDDV